MFPETKTRETSGLEGNQTNWFPEGPDIKCFVIFLHFHFNSKRQNNWSEPKQSIRCCLSIGITLKTLLFSLRLRVCVFVFFQAIHEKENW